MLRSQKSSKDTSCRENVVTCLKEVSKSKFANEDHQPVEHVPAAIKYNLNR